MPDTPTMDTVYFYKFNNYYNRIIKRYDAVADYGTPMLTQTNCNFVHGDGVNSEFTIKKGTLVDTPDYCVVKDYNGNISRWFVTNSFKTRRGQDKVTLRRDLIADFYSDIVKSSPCLIRKGYVDNSSPFIFNNEGVAYNKKKENEILIKDDSNCSYIIGFIANNTPANATVEGTMKEYNYDYAYTSLADFPYKNYVEGAGNTHSSVATIILNNSPENNIYFSIKSNGRTDTGGYRFDMEGIMNSFGLGKPSYYTPAWSSTITTGVYAEAGTSVNNIIVNCAFTGYAVGVQQVEIDNILRTFYPKLFSKLQFSGLIDAARNCIGDDPYTYNELLQYVGKKIKIDNTVYNVTLSAPSDNNVEISYNAYNPTIVSNFTEMASILNSFKPTASEMSTNYSVFSYYSGANRFQGSNLKIISKTQSFYLNLTPASSSIKTDLDSPSDRTHLISQPYDMFMLINTDNFPYKVGATSYTSRHEVNINMAQALCQQSGDAGYDLQIVPFNPIRGSILPDGTINFLNYDVHEIKNSSNAVIGHYVMCNSSDLKFYLEKDELKFNPTDYKKDFNLKQYRLCSPNQETMFEFSPAMNYGINTWEISCNYRPYASYIKVQPTWGGLYGIPQYNGLTDFRGLVYNSSLCITQLNDNYATYINNNKNFQQLFDNQINTLTKQQDIQLSAMEETLGFRAFTGMPISSIMKTIGGMKDIDMQRELNNVALNKMKTDFNYQMDNIKSMPHTIKKLTSINEDTRIFPFIEIYSATPQEEESFDYKMQYTGMTIMTTGYIDSYLKPGEETFIQADLIRLILREGEETADNHIAVEIAAELDKGVYLTKESE